MGLIPFFKVAEEIVSDDRHIRRTTNYFRLICSKGGHCTFGFGEKTAKQWGVLQKQQFATFQERCQKYDRVTRL